MPRCSRRRAYDRRQPHRSRGCIAQQRNNAPERGIGRSAEKNKSRAGGAHQGRRGGNKASGGKGRYHCRRGSAEIHKNGQCAEGHTAHRNAVRHRCGEIYGQTFGASAAAHAHGLHGQDKNLRRYPRSTGGQDETHDNVRKFRICRVARNDRNGAAVRRVFVQRGG